MSGANVTLSLSSFLGKRKLADTISKKIGSEKIGSEKIGGEKKSKKNEKIEEKSEKEGTSIEKRSIVSESSANKINFPRGNSNTNNMILPRSNQAIIAASKLQISQSNDNLFAIREEKPIKKKAKKNSNTEASSEEIQRFDSITFKKLQPDALISLPNGLTGTVTLPEVSDVVSSLVESYLSDSNINLPSLDELLTLGQFVRCSILRTEAGAKGYKIELSLRPSLFVPDTMSIGLQVVAAVASLEDKGYMMSFGSNSPIRGYMPYTNLLDSESRVVVGTVLYCSVAKFADKTKLATLAECDETQECLQENIRWNELLVGSIIHGSISHTTPLGYICTFYGFKGYLDRMHVRNPGETNLEIGSDITARIIRLNHAEKSIYVSMRGHLLDEGKESISKNEVGEKMNVHVLEVQDTGLLCRSSSGALSFLNIANMDAEAPKSLDNHHHAKLGAEIAARVLSVSLFDSLLNLSTRPDFLKEEVMQMKDAIPGKKIKGTIKEITPQGLIVTLSSKVHGFCPVLHCTDIKVGKHTLLRFKIGQSLSFMVLVVKENSLILSLKSGLLNSPFPPLLDYPVTGTKATGYVNNVKLKEKDGKTMIDCVFVSFYNDLFGRIVAPSGNFQQGQTVTVTVISSDKNAKKMDLMLIDKKSDVQFEPLSDITSGTICTAKLLSFSGDSFIVSFTGDNSGTAYLPVSHLTDHISNISELSNYFQARLSEKAVVEINVVAYFKSDKGWLCSSKPSLLEQYALRDSSLELEVGNNYWGIVKSTSEKGVVIRIGDKQALALKSISNLVPDQSVYCQITRLEPGINVTLLEKGNEIYTKGFFAELQFLNKSISFPASVIPDSIQKGTVSKLSSTGVEVKIKSKKGPSVSGIIPSNFIKSSPSVGDSVSFRVYDIYPSNESFEASSLPDHVSEKWGNAPELGHKVKVRVESVKDNYLLVSISASNCFGICLRNSLYSSHKYVVGDMLSGNVCNLPVESSDVSDESNNIMEFYDSNNKYVVVDIDNSHGKFFDSKITEPKDIAVGNFYTVCITSISDTFLNVSFGESSSVSGRINAEYINNLAGQSLISKFKQFEMISALVKKVTMKNGNFYFVSMSLKSTLSTPFASHITSKLPVATKTEFAVGDCLECLVGDNTDGLVVAMDKENRIKVHICDIDENSYKLGEKVKIIVRSLEGGRVWGSIRHRIIYDDYQTRLKELKSHDLLKTPKSKSKTPEPSKDKKSNKEIEKIESILANPKWMDILEVNTISNCLVKAINPNGLFLVELGPGLTTKVHLTEVTDLLCNPLTVYTAGEVLKCYILTNEPLTVSLRPSHYTSVNLCPYFTRPGSFEDVKTNEIVIGIVQKCIKTKGCFLYLSTNVTALIPISELSDSYIPAEQLEAAFPTGKVLLGRVTVVNAEAQRINISLKQSVILPSKSLSFQDLHIGGIVSGKIKKIADFGVFIEIENTVLTGLCHKSEISDDTDFNCGDYYEEGDLVKAKVLKVDSKKRRIALGLKQKYIENGVDLMVKKDMSDEEKEIFKIMGKIKAEEDGVKDETEMSDDEEDNEVEVEEESDAEEGENNDAMEEDDLSDESEASDAEDSMDLEEKEVSVSEEVKEEPILFTKPKSSKASKIAGKANVALFSSLLQDVPELDINIDEVKPLSLSESKEEIHSDSNFVKQLKKQKKVEEEMEIRRQESLLANDSTPESANDFDRHLLASPNSSFLWIKYMEFHINLMQMDHARQVAERALVTIGEREEVEKTNVWVALLNLENLFGNDETLKKVWDRAVRYCDEENLYWKMIAIFEESNPKRAEEFLSKMAKKYKTNLRLWITYIAFRFKTKDAEGARALLSRASQVLLKSQVLELSIKFALLEFKYGNIERARSVMEKILDNHSKRSDIWSMYIDQEIKHKDVSYVRSLFDRAIALNLSSTKMKFFFKRYLQFESDNGNDSTISEVKEKARLYVESKQE